MDGKWAARLPAFRGGKRERKIQRAIRTTTHSFERRTRSPLRKMGGSGPLEDEPILDDDRYRGRPWEGRPPRFRSPSRRPPSPLRRRRKSSRPSFRRARPCHWRLRLARPCHSMLGHGRAIGDFDRGHILYKKGKERKRLVRRARDKNNEYSLLVSTTKLPTYGGVHRTFCTTVLLSKDCHFFLHVGTRRIIPEKCVIEKVSALRTTL